MKNVEQLLQNLVLESVKQEEATLAGDSKSMNQQYLKIRKIREEIRNSEDKAFDRIRLLLSHENNYVRYNAALSILPLYPEEARKTLQDIASLKGSIGFTAEMTLREWNSGNLKF